MKHKQDKKRQETELELEFLKKFSSFYHKFFCYMINSSFFNRKTTNNCFKITKSQEIPEKNCFNNFFTLEIKEKC